MPRLADNDNPARTFSLVLVIATTAILYLAKAILVPFALAILLSFLLAPMVTKLERWRLGRAGSVMIVVAATGLVIAGVLWLVIEQAIDVADNLPEYRQNVAQKLDALQGRGGAVGKLRDLLHEFNETMADPKQDRSEGRIPVDPPENGKEHPMAVAIVSQSTAWSTASEWLPTVWGLIGNAGVVIIFVVFMLIEREDLRNRLIRLIGPGRMSLTTQAMDDATRRVSKYLRAQLIVNATYGLAVTVGLFVIGIPNSPLWGLLAGLLRYIPIAGPAIAAAGPIALATAAFENWSVPLFTIALFVALEMVTNNVLEPLLYRSSTGISTVGILVATVFWTWMWGAVGLILATPLTVCIAVMGRYVPQLGFLDTLLSGESVLSPGAHYYQRLLAGDQDEAETLVERRLAAGSVEDVYLQVLMPALVLSQEDRRRGNLMPGKHDFILEAIRETVEELPERLALASAENAPASTAETLQADQDKAHAASIEPVPFSEHCVICLPARDEADEIAALMLTQLLKQRGFDAQCISVKALASEMLEQVEARQAGTVCISAVPPFTINHARYLSKLLASPVPQSENRARLVAVAAHRRQHRSPAPRIVCRSHRDVARTGIGGIVTLSPRAKRTGMFATRAPRA